MSKERFKQIWDVFFLFLLGRRDGVCRVYSVGSAFLVWQAENDRGNSGELSGLFLGLCGWVGGRGGGVSEVRHSGLEEVADAEEEGKMRRAGDQGGYNQTPSVAVNHPESG